MNRTPDYYSVLAGAVAQLERDSFEARWGIYERAWQMVIKEFGETQNYSEEDIARERSAFRRAICRIEFGESEILPSADHQRVRQDNIASPAISKHIEKSRIRPIRGRLLIRMTTACFLMVVCGLTYAVMTGQIRPSSLENWVDDGKPGSWWSQLVRNVVLVVSVFEGRLADPSKAVARAVLYEESDSDPIGKMHVGSAIWRADAATAGATTKSEFMLSIDVEIPKKGVVLKITARRDREAGSVISHLVEFQFKEFGVLPSAAVANVLGILMKNDERARGVELAGKVIKVSPGVFLLGLSGAEGDVHRNLALLKDRPWLDVPIVFNDGSRSILAIEKGAAGQQAVNNILGRWAGS